ncbi:MAG: hypothetical protein EZS28_003898 [Streblomastix strix]|uniref:Uncharacterized protein n=1 Tax=Streblomastix strix TaxID=222440 RepID=A0A5J4WZZ9_9EUKA|nr:MAG: hypothetical protein EZS28_003898 [Streblomastix strix]
MNEKQQMLNICSRNEDFCDREQLFNAYQTFFAKDSDSCQEKMTTDEKLKYEKEMTKKATTLSLQEMRDDLDGINRDVYNNQGDRN